MSVALPLVAVVGDIPAAALENEAGAGDEAFGGAIANRAGDFPLLEIVLPLFENLLALVAAIFVYRHRSLRC
jgi:hypothetical protein